MQCFKLFWYGTRFLSTELLNFLVDSVLVFFTLRLYCVLFHFVLSLSEFVWSFVLVSRDVLGFTPK